MIGFDLTKMRRRSPRQRGPSRSFITVLSLIDTIEQAFNTIWQVRFPNSKAFAEIQRLLDVLLVGPVLVFRGADDYGYIAERFFRSSFACAGTIRNSMLTLFSSPGPLCHSMGSIHTSLTSLSPNLSQIATRRWSAVLWPRYFGRQSLRDLPHLCTSSTHLYAIYSSFAILLCFSSRSVAG